MFWPVWWRWDSQFVFQKCPAHVVLKTSHPQPLSPKLPRSITPQAAVLRPPPSSRASGAPEQPKSILLVEAEKSEAPHQSTPADIPVQIFVTDGDTEQQKHSEGLMVSPSPPPPPPPPPLPPPPLPPPLPFQLKTLSATEDKPLPLISDSPAESPALHRQDDLSRRSINNCIGKKAHSDCWVFSLIPGFFCSTSLWFWTGVVCSLA